MRTVDLAASRRFYEEVLGLVAGPRPDFPFPGHWMYQGDLGNPAHAVVHLIGLDAQAPAGLAGYLGARDAGTLRGSGAVDHIAFFADGLAAMRRHLAGLGIACRERSVPGLGLHQLFLDDPDGIVIELNYPAAEAAAAGAAALAPT
ncbi:putative dioxygenase [Piscinibacter sakaiensis]|uniref:Putative dioxygenase n=1 Tax=Piscinibacter sakaiensis TaxID=1547922 RepID=A0A0K8P5A8_PISS1|nr:putative dioxygenase [Piscinibacter sakaiensis]